MMSPPAHKQVTPFLQYSKQPRNTHIVAVMDRSSSMWTKRPEVLEGFNRFMDEQKTLKTEGETFFSLHMFSHASYTAVNHVPINTFNKLDETNYVPEGNTALLDAIAQAIHSTPAGEKVVFVIQTDGEENASRNYSNASLNQLISRKQEDGWQFIFLGANVDSFRVASAIGINLNTVANYDDKVLGQTRQAYLSASASVGAMRGNADFVLTNSGILRDGLIGNDNVPDGK